MKSIMKETNVKTDFGNLTVKQIKRIKPRTKLQTLATHTNWIKFQLASIKAQVGGVEHELDFLEELYQIALDTISYQVSKIERNLQTDYKILATKLREEKLTDTDTEET
jgi:ASC-1-like (ASCH) protein